MATSPSSGQRILIEVCSSLQAAERWCSIMIIRAGFEAAFDFAQPTEVVLVGNIHPERAATIRQLEILTATPYAPIGQYYDTYGNLCGRTVVPAGRVTFRTSALVEDDGLVDVQMWDALQHRV